MTIFSRRTDPNLSWWEKLGIYLFNWVMWIVPAFADATANDMGREAQGRIAAITTIGIFLFAVVPLMAYFRFGADGGQCLAFSAIAYLVVGLIYHANEAWGPYS